MTALVIVAAWYGAATAQPSSLSLHSAIFDATRQRMIVFGGTPDFQALKSELWELTLDLDPQWAMLTPSGVGPSARLGHTATHDLVRDQMIVLGGEDSLRVPRNDVWVLGLSNHAWSALEPSGTKPIARRYHSAIYDPVRDRLVVFGGDAGNSTPLNDVWALWLTPTPRWERLISKGGPPVARYNHSAVYDPVRDRMIVFGGFPVLDDAWALSFSDTSWAFLGQSGPLPPARFGHSAIYQPVGDRMVVFGGFNGGTQYFDDTWFLPLSGGGWSPLESVPPLPSPRLYHTAVYDSAYDRMVVFGGTPTVTEPTWALSLEGQTRWSPARPFLEASPADLVLPTVTIGDTVSVTFSLGNRGLEPLAIQSFELPSAQLTLSNPAPSALPWNSGLTETLRLAAAIPGDLPDSIIIVSNDPVTPRRRVRLSAEVLGLAFETQVLGRPDTVPGGQSFIVVITPEADVIVERGTLYYRVAGGGSPFDSLSLTPLATDFIGSIPAAAVTEHGVEYYARVENSGFSAVQPPTAPTAFYTQWVSVPDTIPLPVIARPTSGAGYLDGRAIDVDVVLPGGAVFESGTLHVRRGGEGVTRSMALAPSGTPGQVSATIPDTLVGARGLEYWVEVMTVQDTLHGPEGGPAVLRVTVPNLVETAVHPGGRYRLLSVPLDFGPDFLGSLDGLLTEQLGTYDPTWWRSFVYDPARSGNIEFSAAEGALFRPRPGRAFWLISRDDHRVDSEPVAGLSTATVEQTIALAPGWNMIGNPFAFAVAWADVIRDAGVEDPVAFDPTRGTIGDYAEATPNVLVPFEGYFVYASQAAALRIPPQEAPAPSAPTAARTSASVSESGWRLRLHASSETAMDSSNVFGVQAGAGTGWDTNDRRKPPRLPGPWVRAPFAHPDWEERSGDYRIDLRSPATEGETWEVEVRSATAGEPISIAVGEISSLPPDRQLRIIDREQKTATDWRRTGDGPTIRIVSFGPRPYRLAIAVGTEEYLDRAAAIETPRGAALDATSPNPFRLATRIRFAVPRAARVSLEVYNVLGERVATLVDHAVLEPGFHTALWDGKTNRGRPAPSGVYLIRLQAEEEAFTRRVVLVR